MLNRTAPYAVELDGELSVCLEGEVRPLDEVRHLKGNCRVVSDLQGAIARTMTVEADSRYAELIISKKLQETGEFDEPVTVIAHWKKKQTKHSTQIFFSALPTRSYLQYLELVREFPHHLLLLPLQSVLLAALHKKANTGPAAVVFQHDRFADIIVGTSRQVWYANRVVAFDASAEQIENLWDTVRTDIQSVGRDHRRPIHKVYLLTWTTTQPLPSWGDPDGLEVVHLDEESVRQDNQERNASLPAWVARTPGASAIASSVDRACFRARRILPYVNMLFLLLALICASGGYRYQRQTLSLQLQIDNLRQNEAKMKKWPVMASSQETYKPIMTLLEQLWRSRALPGYSQLLRDLSAGPGSDLKLEVLKADYDDRKVRIEAFGTSRAPFEVSYKAYQGLQQQLRQRGYDITQERFDTRIDRSDFMIQYAKELP